MSTNDLAGGQPGSFGHAHIARRPENLLPALARRELHDLRRLGGRVEVVGGQQGDPLVVVARVEDVAEALDHEFGLFEAAVPGRGVGLVLVEASIEVFEIAVLVPAWDSGAGQQARGAVARDTFATHRDRAYARTSTL